MHLIKTIAITTLLLGSFCFISCDDEHGNAPYSIQQAFSTKYPNASVREWDYKNGYLVAEFNNNGYEAEAWFDAQGQWYMTETDYNRDFSQVPQVVQQAFLNSQYASWYIDDIHMLEYPAQTTAYVFDLELGEREYQLRISADGTLLSESSNVNDSTVSDDNSGTENNPNQSDNSQDSGQSIVSAVNNLYPNASIVEIDREHNRIEVDIVHENIGKEVLFDTFLNWIYTKWDIRSMSLPTAILQYVQTNYANARIDDAEYYESPSGNYYEIEIELHGDRDVTLWFDTNGNVVNNPFL